MFQQYPMWVYQQCLKVGDTEFNLAETFFRAGPKKKKGHKSRRPKRLSDVWQKKNRSNDDSAKAATQNLKPIDYKPVKQQTPKYKRIPPYSG